MPWRRVGPGCAHRGLQLVSNSGGVIRTLPVAGPACAPSRWWNSSAYGSQLLVQAPSGCSPTAALLWFDPSTRHVHSLFNSGVLGAVPYGQPTLGY